jgi:hypothetical protein
MVNELGIARREHIEMLVEAQRGDQRRGSGEPGRSPS